MLPIYREREVGFITHQTGANLLIVPSVWRDFDFEAMARTIAAGTLGLEVLVCDKNLPDGDPSTLGPPAPGGSEPFQPGVATDGPWRWVFYTSGTTADPEGRAPHRQDRRRVRVRDGPRARDDARRTATRWSSRSRTSAASAGCSPG